MSVLAKSSILGIWLDFEVAFRLNNALKTSCKDREKVTQVPPWENLCNSFFNVHHKIFISFLKNYLEGLQLIKKRLQHWCFLVKSAKFLKTFWRTSANDCFWISWTGEWYWNIKSTLHINLLHYKLKSILRKKCRFFSRSAYIIQMIWI